MTHQQFFVAGGTLEGDAPCYVERCADREILDAVRQREICYALTARQMGKSSLMVRTVEKLRDDGWTAVVADLTNVGSNLTPDQWYYSVGSLLARQMDLRQEARAYWQEHSLSSPVQRWLGLLQEVMLPRCRFGLAVFVDEIDFVRSLPFSTHEFFAAIRSCHSRARVVPEFGPVFCLLGAATPAELIDDPDATPFNIGKRIELGDFAPGDCRPLEIGLQLGSLNASVRSEAEARRILQRILHWTGGHPYLTQKLCAAVTEQPQVREARGVDRLCRDLFLAPGAIDQDDHLYHLREWLLRDGVGSEVFLRFRELRNGQRLRVLDTDDAGAALRSIGLAVAREGFLQIRNRVYAQVFDSAWVEGHLQRGSRSGSSLAGAPSASGASPPPVPGTEGPQRLPRRTPRIRTAILTSLVVAGPLGIGWFWEQQQAGERTYREGLRSYADQIRIAAEALDTGEPPRARDTLAQVPTAYREWYWRHLWLRAAGATATLPPVDVSPPLTIRFAPGTHTLLASDLMGHLRSWDGRQGTEAWIKKIPQKQLTDQPLSFPAGGLARSGNRAAFVLQHKSLTASPGWWVLYVYDRTNGKLWQLPGTSSQAVALALDPEGRQVTVATALGVNGPQLVQFTQREWEWARSIRSVPAGIRGLAYSSEGKALAAYGAGVLLLQERSLRRVQVPYPYVSALAFAPDDKTLAVGEGQKDYADMTTPCRVALLPLVGGGSRTIFRADAPVTGLSVSDTGDRLAVATRRGSVLVLNPKELRDTAVIRDHGPLDPVVEFSSDGKLLAVGDSHGALETWDLSRGVPLRSAPSSRTKRRVAIENFEQVPLRLQEGEWEISRDRRGVVWVLRPRWEGPPVQLATGVRNPPLAVTKRGGFAAVGIGATAWLLRRGEARWHPLPAASVIRSLAFSPDGRTLAGAERDGSVRLWDLRSERWLGSLPPLPGAGPLILRDLQFTVGGSLVGQADGVHLEWDSDPGERN